MCFALYTFRTWAGGKEGVLLVSIGFVGSNRRFLCVKRACLMSPLSRHCSGMNIQQNTSLLHTEFTSIYWYVWTALWRCCIRRHRPQPFCRSLEYQSNINLLLIPRLFFLFYFVLFCCPPSQVVPVTPDIGLVEWVKNTRPLKSIIEEGLGQALQKLEANGLFLK